MYNIRYNYFSNIYLIFSWFILFSGIFLLGFLFFYLFLWFLNSLIMDSSVLCFGVHFFFRCFKFFPEFLRRFLSCSANFLSSINNLKNTSKGWSIIQLILYLVNNTEQQASPFNWKYFTFIFKDFIEHFFLVNDTFAKVRKFFFCNFGSYFCYRFWNCLFIWEIASFQHSISTKDFSESYLKFSLHIIY